MGADCSWSGRDVETRRYSLFYFVPAIICFGEIIKKTRRNIFPIHVRSTIQIWFQNFWVWYWETHYARTDNTFPTRKSYRCCPKTRSYKTQFYHSEPCFTEGQSAGTSALACTRNTSRYCFRKFHHRRHVNLPCTHAPVSWWTIRDPGRFAVIFEISFLPPRAVHVKPNEQCCNFRQTTFDEEKQCGISFYLCGHKDVKNCRFSMGHGWIWLFFNTPSRAPYKLKKMYKKLMSRFLLAWYYRSV